MIITGLFWNLCTIIVFPSSRITHKTSWSLVFDDVTANYSFIYNLKFEKVLTFCIICITRLKSDWIIEICNVVHQRWLRKGQTIQQVNTFVVGWSQVSLFSHNFLVNSIAYRRWSRYVREKGIIRRKMRIFLPHISENAQMKNENFNESIAN